MHGLGPDERRQEILEVRKRWLTRQKGLGAILTEIVTRNPFAGRTDPEADRALAQLDVMQGELAERPYALAHGNVHVWADSQDEAHERAARVASLLNAQGLEARLATLNNIYAPLADMPGNVTEEVMNVRRARVEIAAITRLAPVTGVSVGSRSDWRFGGSALLVGTTRKATPFYWSLNAPGSDSAHTAIVGATGSGKSVLIAFMAAQFLRYPGARVVVFDRRRSFMVPCLALGGDWIELGGRGHGVQPLRAVDQPEELAWAHGWIVKALRTRGHEVKAHTEAAITTALAHVADLPPDRRTLTSLHGFLAGDDAARKALQVYLDGQGPYGKLFDGVVASYGDAPVMGIETQDVMQLEAAAPLVISAMFRAVQRQRLTGDAPKLVVIDEAWSLLQSDLFGREIEGWAREMRKLKAALVLATQSLADLADGRMRVIFDQLGNRVYLPHAEALRPQTRELYERAGLLEEQIRVLAVARPKAEYLIQTGDVTRLVEIRLEDEALRLCGASTPVDHGRALAMLEQGTAPGRGVHPAVAGPDHGRMARRPGGRLGAGRGLAEAGGSHGHDARSLRPPAGPFCPGGRPRPADLVADGHGHGHLLAERRRCRPRRLARDPGQPGPGRALGGLSRRPEPARGPGPRRRHLAARGRHLRRFCQPLGPLSARAAPGSRGAQISARRGDQGHRPAGLHRP